MSYKFNGFDVGRIARVAHEANRAYCEMIGDESQPSWDFAPEWQRDSARNGVTAHLGGNLTPQQSHEAWFRQKELEGWMYGPAKNVMRKQHPCMVPYDQLPVEQRRKDYIFKAVVEAFKNAMEVKE